MKIVNFGFFFLSMLLLGSLLTTGCNKEDDDVVIPEEPELVNFPDARLLAQVKLALGLSESEDVNEENILALDTLNIDAGNDLSGNISGIADLTGLEKAENLVYIHMGATSVTNLQPLSGLKKVTYFRINNTAVTDLSPLSAYTTLTYFNANTATSLSDISPLAGNTGLNEMILRSVPMGTAGLQTISNFNGLYRLNIRETGVTDISMLADMMANGALLNSTPGAAEEGGATLDLRQLEIDCSPIMPYIDQIANLDGC